MSGRCAGWIGGALMGAGFAGAGLVTGSWGVALAGLALGLCSGALAALEG